jgi:hypothetical protein
MTGAGYLLPLAATLALVLGSCGDRGTPGTSDGLCALPYNDTSHYFPQSIEREIDVLLVVDTSPAMQVKADQLAKSLPKMIEVLRSPRLGNDLPDLHIGVVSADLGAGPYSLPGCKAGGDGAKLLHAPRQAGCTPPSNPWISYIARKTNVPGSGDPIERVKQGLSCIGDLGDSGCLFAQPLEAARRALDPKLNLNPGFLRKDAFLMLVFLTSGDDCSAKKPQLFDPNQTQINDPLGPLTPFRCFEFGVTCDCPAGNCTRQTVGTRTNCMPAHDWLHRIEDYAVFFGKLKPPGRMLVSVVSGPTDTVAVGMDNMNPTLRPSCNTGFGQGTPAIRLAALATAINKSSDKAYFNQGVKYPYQTVPVTICDGDHSPAVGWPGQRIVTMLGGTCIQGPVLTRDCGLACAAGVALDTGPSGGSKTCQRSCLEQADCSVELAVPVQPRIAVSPCPSVLFRDASRRDCGGSCPCWRLVAKKICAGKVDGSPYSLEVLHENDRAPKGSVAVVHCATSLYDWGSERMLALPVCSGD